MTNFGPFSVAMLDQNLLARLQDGMARVEESLMAATKGESPTITERARHLYLAGGKRFRPALALLAAQFGDGASPSVVATATACELTHLATLHHDDVMDEAEWRRNAPSANARWGNLSAILTGDFLFAKASLILAELGPEAVTIQARTFERLVTGQIAETDGPSEDDDPLAHYLDVVANKTGSLIATSARFGALMSGADGEVVRILTDFGELIGIAFQLADDILDITSDTTLSGKTPGTDLKGGVATLPVIRVRSDPGAGDERLLKLLDSDLTDKALHGEALALIRAHPAMELARQDCAGYAEQARSVLDPLPGGPVRDALNILCDLAVHRAR